MFLKKITTIVSDGREGDRQHSHLKYTRKHSSATLGKTKRKFSKFPSQLCTNFYGNLVFNIPLIGILMNFLPLMMNEEYFINTKEQSVKDAMNSIPFQYSVVMSMAVCIPILMDNILGEHIILINLNTNRFKAIFMIWC